jgi:hypothetical protein
MGKDTDNAIEELDRCHSDPKEDHAHSRTLDHGNQNAEQQRDAPRSGILCEAIHDGFAQQTGDGESGAYATAYEGNYGTDPELPGHTPAPPECRRRRELLVLPAFTPEPIISQTLYSQIRFHAKVRITVVEFTVGLLPRRDYGRCTKSEIFNVNIRKLVYS